MEKLLQMAMDAADQVEVFYQESNQTSLSMRNGSVTEMSTSMNSGYSLRLIRQGILGTAYTQNLIDRKDLLSNAIASMEGGVDAGYRFPEPHEPAQLDTLHPSVEDLGYSDSVASCRHALEKLRGRVSGQIDSRSGFYRSFTRIINSNSMDVSSSKGGFYVGTDVLFPGTETSIGEFCHFLDKGDIPDERLDELVDLYSRGLPEVDAPTGRMKVLFHPYAMNTLTWRLRSALSARSFYYGTSPLLDRLGEKVLSEKITFFDDPHAGGALGATPVDDEGMPTHRLSMIEGGVFRNRYTNLDYAVRLGIEPTGNGYRGGDAIAGLPAADLAVESLAAGDASFAGMISSIDEGVIILGALGAHSGNILNGDFSVGMNPGLLVRNGLIVGRVRDGMVAGNVWDVLQRVVSVENTIHNPAGWARYPSLLLEGVSVSARRS